MEKVLGLDLGTNSIGWAIIQREGDCCTLIDKGVSIFQEGVAREQGAEKPAVQTRTDARALRRAYRRRRKRKIDLLRVLVDHELCPPLTHEQLDLWQQKKRYPLDEAFLAWQRTDEATGRNPYRDRYRALSEQLDLTGEKGRYTLGRALYHIAQRRGFLSNRRDNTAESEGKVKQGIDSLTEAMKAAGCRYLGEYFYMLYGKGEKIRNHYTSRNDHYRAEFDAICSRQQLDPTLTDKLRRAIFYQRPLKSQKGTVGKCTFEKGKSRCPLSHPRFEEFRMLSFINNIRITTPYDFGASRPLNEEERAAAIRMFMRKSKPTFDFEDIAKALAGRKRSYAYEEDAGEAPYRFNYRMSTSVSGCPTTAALADIFGEDWVSGICSLYTRAEGKTKERIVDDVWHVLFSFDDDDRLRQWAAERLQLSEADAEKFAAITPKQGYAALSLNAIDKILPYLRAGRRYDEAVFCANIKAAVPAEVRSDEQLLGRITDEVSRIVADFKPDPTIKADTKQSRIEGCMREHGIEADMKKLYHPSMIETYRKAEAGDDGLVQLGSPRTSSVRNPMAMRALFRMRALLNRLLREGRIDPMTKINIEFARGLNDANKRKAIEQWQREREKENKRYAQEIRKLYEEQTGSPTEPSEEDILKYRLYEEQNHICLYTGRQISITDFIGSSASCDIEHTLPRSRGGDDSQMNKTLCDNRFNRETKCSKLPSELSEHSDVMARIEQLGWKQRIDDLHKQIETASRRSKNATTKEDKDKAIQHRHKLRMQLDYWQGKYERFTMTEVPEGFANRQGVDIGIIGRYARLYLKSVFERIYTVKGATTAAFRKMWGLQEEDSEKERTNHAHHCIDAITIACIGRNEYDRWAQYAAKEEDYRRCEDVKPSFDKPWPTFTEDVRAVADELLVAHSTPDNMSKPTKKRLRKRGRIVSGDDRRPIIVTGDSARASLHKETFYGAIKRDDEIKYVVRKALTDLDEKDIDKIVDEAVRARVRDAVERLGFTQAVAGTIWMNEQKRIPINRVRIFVPTVTAPIKLKEHRDLSVKEHKRHYHVVNDGNYCMAIYEGQDKKGRPKRSFEIVNNLEAAEYFKTSADRSERPDLVPRSDACGNPLRCILKTGTMVLFYENSPEELYDCSKRELAKRLYKLTKFSTLRNGNNSYGTLVFRHHQEARPASELKPKSGVWKIDEEYRPLIILYHTQLNALVEGSDFELTVTGEIIFKHRSHD